MVLAHSSVPGGDLYRRRMHSALGLRPFRTLFHPSYPKRGARARLQCTAGTPASRRTPLQQPDSPSVSVDFGGFPCVLVGFGMIRRSPGKTGTALAISRKFRTFQRLSLPFCCLFVLFLELLDTPLGEPRAPSSAHPGSHTPGGFPLVLAHFSVIFDKNSIPGASRYGSEKKFRAPKEHIRVC